MICVLCIRSTNFGWATSEILKIWNSKFGPKWKFEKNWVKVEFLSFKIGQLFSIKSHQSLSLSLSLELLRSYQMSPLPFVFLPLLFSPAKPLSLISLTHSLPRLDEFSSSVSYTCRLSGVTGHRNPKPRPAVVYRSLLHRRWAHDVKTVRDFSVRFLVIISLDHWDSIANQLGLVCSTSLYLDYQPTCMISDDPSRCNPSFWS